MICSFSILQREIGRTLSSALIVKEMRNDEYNYLQLSEPKVSAYVSVRPKISLVSIHVVTQASLCCQTAAVVVVEVSSSKSMFSCPSLHVSCSVRISQDFPQSRANAARIR